MVGLLISNVLFLGNNQGRDFFKAWKLYTTMLKPTEYNGWIVQSYCFDMISDKEKFRDAYSALH